MSLKFRYATFLLATFGLLGLFCAASLYLVIRGHYLATGVLLVLLYLIAFQIGKRFSVIFFTLSTLKLLKNNAGIITVEKYNETMNRTMGTRSSRHKREELKKEILDTLVREGEITISNDRIVLNSLL